MKKKLENKVKNFKQKSKLLRYTDEMANNQNILFEEKTLEDLYTFLNSLDLKDIEFYTRLSYWKHAMIMEGVYIRYSMGSYGKTNENEIESFKNSTIKFANKAANKNLLEEIT